MFIVRVTENYNYDVYFSTSIRTVSYQTRALVVDILEDSDGVRNSYCSYFSSAYKSNTISQFFVAYTRTDKALGSVTFVD